MESMCLVEGGQLGFVRWRLVSSPKYSFRMSFRWFEMSTRSCGMFTAMRLM